MLNTNLSHWLKNVQSRILGVRARRKKKIRENEAATGVKRRQSRFRQRTTARSRQRRLSVNSATVELLESRTLLTTLIDGDGLTWDLDTDGRTLTGSSNFFIGPDNGFKLDGFPSALETMDSPREVVFGPVTSGSSLDITRKVYVPDNAGYARYLEIVTNFGSSAESYTVEIDTTLGSVDDTGISATSSGDTSFDTSDDWIVTNNGGSHKVLHVTAGTDSPGPNAASLSGSLGHRINYSYNLQVPTNETQIIMHFGAQSLSGDPLPARGALLADLDSSLNPLSGMSPEEVGQLVNFTVDLVVDNDGDAIDEDYSDGQLSLREALRIANARPGHDTITFDSSLAGSTIILGETTGFGIDGIKITDNVDIVGLGADQLAISGDDNSRVFDISGSATEVLVDGLTFRDGFTGNSLGGGAIRALNSQQLTILKSVFDDNSTSGPGGAISANGTDLDIQNSTFSSNTGLFGGGAVNATETLTVLNSTFVANSTNLNGGAIAAAAGGQIRNSTIVGNTADANNTGNQTQGGGLNVGTAGFELYNTIVAGNFDGTSNPQANDIGASNGALSNLSSHNLIGVGIGGSVAGLTDGVDGNQVGVDWKTVVANDGTLPILADNGGPTPTLALLPNSPAINAGNEAELPESQEIIRPISVTTTTVNDFSPVTNLIDNNSITLANYESVTDFSNWNTDDRNGGTGSDYFSAGDDPLLTFDLGSVQRISHIAIWGIHFAINHDVKAFRVLSSNDGGQTFQFVDTLEKDRYDGTTNVVTTMSFQPVEANMIRLQIQGNYFGESGGGGGDRVAMNEVRFLNLTGTDQRGLGFQRSVGVSDIGAFEAPFANDEPLVVDTLEFANDEDYGPGKFSMLEAILIANQRPGADEITFDSSLNGGVIEAGDMGVLDDLHVRGPGASQLKIRGDGFVATFLTAGSTIDLTIEGLTLQGTASSGRAIQPIASSPNSITVIDTVVEGHSSTQQGGAIYATNATDVTIVNSRFSGNSSATTGGAISMDGTGTLTISGSTFDGNSATDAGAVLALSNPVFIDNSTFVGNSATELGGAIAAAVGTIRNSTIVGNIADSDNTLPTNDPAGGGILTGFAPVGLSLFNTILAGNFDSTDSTQTASEYRGNAGFVTTSSHNIIGDAATSAGLTNGTNSNQVGVDWTTVVQNNGVTPTLTNNGGPLPSVAILATGPAIDAGDNAQAVDTFGNALITDGRGNIFPRSFDGDSNSSDIVDIGAFEHTTGLFGGFLRDDPNPTLAASVAFSVDFNFGSNPLLPHFFIIVTSGSVVTDPTVEIDDLGDSDDSTWQVVVTGVSGTGTVGLDFIPSISTGTPIDESYDIIDDRHDLLNVSGRVAGNAVASISGSNLTITPDADDNGISVSQRANGDVVVAGQGGTTINGVDEFVAFIGDLNNLTIIGSDGRDLLYVDGLNLTGSVNITGGTEADSVITKSVTPAVNLIIKEEAGDGFVDVVQTDVGNILQVFGGDGSDTFTVEGGTITGLAFFTDSGTSASENDVGAITNTTFENAFNTNLGHGNDTLTLAGVTLNADAVIATAADSDDVTLTDVLAMEAFTLNTGNHSDVVLLQNSVLAKRTLLVTENGNDEVQILGGTLGTETNIQTGGGSDDLTLNHPTLNGPMAFQTGAGHDSFTAIDVHSLSVVSLDSGSGNDDIVFQGLIAEQQMSIATVSGTNSLTIEDSSDFKSFLTVNTGINSDTITIENNNFDQTLNVNTGGGSNVMVVNQNSIGGQFTLSGTQGTSNLTIRDSALSARTIVTTGGGNDRVDLFGGTFTGVVTVSTQDGDDFLRIQNGMATATFDSTVNLLAGNAASGTDSVLVATSQFNSNFNVRQGTGASTIQLEPATIIEGVTTIHPGLGADNILLTDARFKGNVFSTLGSGGDGFTATGGTNFDASVFLTGGIDVDTVMFEAATIGGDLNMNLLQADDVLTFKSTTTVMGVTNVATFTGRDTVNVDDSTLGTQTIIDTGSQNDTINLTSATFNGTTILNTSTQNDRVVGDGVTANGIFQIDFGNNNDTLRMTDLNAQGAMTIKLGSGHDQTQIRESALSDTLTFVIPSGNNVVDLFDTTFFEHVQAVASAPARLGARIRSNTFEKTSNFFGGGTLDDVFLENSTNTFNGPPANVQGIEDLSNDHIGAVFGDLMGLLFP